LSRLEDRDVDRYDITRFIDNDRGAPRLSTGGSRADDVRAGVDGDALAPQQAGNGDSLTLHLKVRHCCGLGRHDEP
jgi:hypothetical protein